MSRLLCCAMIFLPGTLHAQAPASGAQASPPPAATAAVSATDAKTSEPAKPLEAAAQLYRAGKLTEAEAAYKAILQSEPQSADAYAGLARLNLRQRRLPEAKAALAKAVELGSKSNAVRVAQGEVHFRQGRILEAQDDFTPLVKANAPEPRAYLGFGQDLLGGIASDAREAHV
jgi:predicted Zn-dependent protease